MNIQTTKRKDGFEAVFRDLSSGVQPTAKAARDVLEQKIRWACEARFPWCRVTAFNGATYSMFVSPTLFGWDTLIVSIPRQDGQPIITTGSVCCDRDFSYVVSLCLKSVAESAYNSTANGPLAIEFGRALLEEYKTAQDQFESWAKFQERYRKFKRNGLSEEDAFKAAVNGFGGGQ